MSTPNNMNQSLANFSKLSSNQMYEPSETTFQHFITHQSKENDLMQSLIFDEKPMVNIPEEDESKIDIILNVYDLTK